MNNVVVEEASRRRPGISLSALEGLPAAPVTPAHVSLGEAKAVVTLQEAAGNETMVALQEAGENEPLILCPLEEPGAAGVRQGHAHHHLPTGATLTYAALDEGVNIVLQPLKTEPHAHASPVGLAGDDAHQVRGADGCAKVGGGGGGGPQLVVVGDAGAGDTMTYIYIQGESQGEQEGGVASADAHTITLNSADGSTLHTLPAAYTQHLEHAYGDLVLVGGGSGAADVGGAAAAGGTRLEDGDGGADEGRRPDEEVLLLSVAPIKLEEQDGGAALALPAPARSAPSHVRDSRPSAALEESVSAGRGRREGGRQEARLPEDEAGTIEARLATRDSLLPPRRNRRCGNPGGLTCPVCRTQFKSGRQYHGHLHVHRGHGVWQCDMCEHTSDTAVALSLHKSEAHHEARPYKCPHCALSFPKSLMLEDHVRSVHNKERPYTCSFCTKGFYRPHDLKMHLNLHLGIKSNVCHVCGRQFSHPSNLIRHQRLHTGIKPYVCFTCGKRFTQVTLLHQHRASHQPGAGVCPLCPATFRSAAGLRKHSKLEHKKPMTLQEAARIIRGQRTSTGRSYYCQVCGAQFSIKSELKAHEQQEHGDSTEHRCASCNKVFSTAEVKSHTCLTAEEEERRNRLLGPQELSTSAALTSITATPVNAHPVAKEDIEGEEEEEEEEEYLVVHIEGERVSYVVKKGTKSSRNKVLEIDAARPDALSEDDFPRAMLSEKTIMINVQDRPGLLQDGQTMMSLPPEIEEGESAPAGLGGGEDSASGLDHMDADKAALPLASIKLEPQTEDDLDQMTLPDKALLPIVSLDTLSPPAKVSRKPGLRPISAKKSRNIALKGECDDLNLDEDTKVGGGGGAGAVAPLTCRNCGKVFQKRWNFQQHIATHDASLHKYKCDTCGHTFAYRSTLNKHVLKHRSPPQLHPCQLCKKTYKRPASLKQHHKREHMQQRPYVCELCGKDFFGKSDFKYHMRIHKKEQPYMCFACGREFSHLSHLHRHERIHTGERPHKCPYCPKKFIQLVTLKIHLKKHEKLAPEELKPADEGLRGKEEVSLNLGLGEELVGEQANLVAAMDESLCNPSSATSLGVSSANAITTSASTISASIAASQGSAEGEEENSGALGVHTNSDLGLERALSTNAAALLANTSASAPRLTMDGFPPGTVILAQGGLEDAEGGGQFSGGHTAVVAGVNGDCIAIFVQDANAIS
ncbi:zinc finger protein 585A [Penaeus vannamei]|uniref:zinc finger protein 585A n=1 Tax=Penaeus vannamei TaxID=6689 RepID=UPI00387F5B89